MLISLNPLCGAVVAHITFAANVENILLVLKLSDAPHLFRKLWDARGISGIYPVRILKKYIHTIKYCCQAFKIRLRNTS